jgi:leucyl aminopeptidase
MAQRKSVNEKFATAIDRRIKTLTTSSTKLNDYIHETAMQIITHADKHGDCSAALRLFTAFPKSFKRDLFMQWLKEFTPIRINSSTGKVGMLKETNIKFVAFDLEAANAKPFYDMEKAPNSTKIMTVDSETEALAKYLDGRIKRIEAALEANDGLGELGEMPKTMIDPESVAGLRELLEQIKRFDVQVIDDKPVVSYIRLAA